MPRWFPVQLCVLLASGLFLALSLAKSRSRQAVLVFLFSLLVAPAASLVGDDGAPAS